MSFSEGDLESLKERKRTSRVSLTADKMEALVRRLQEAEKIILQDHPDDVEPCSICKPWRKSKGEVRVE